MRPGGAATPMATARRLAPGPRGHPLFGMTPALRRDSLRACAAAWRRYGDVVRMPLGGPYVAHVLVHPEHVKHVLQERHRDYGRAPWYNGHLKKLLGEGLLTSEGELWRHQRRLMQPAFHHDRIAALAPRMTDATLAMLERWDGVAGSGQPVDVAREMMELTLRIVARTLLGSDVEPEAQAIGRAVTVATRFVVDRMQSYVDLPAWLPLPAQRRFQAARALLDANVYRIIQARRRTGAHGDDLLSLLLQARDPDSGAGMSDQQLRDEVMTIFLAGHETTALALTWTWYLLSLHPDARRRLQAELAEVLGGRPPTYADLPHLAYTRMVVDEALRLYPPAWSLVRWPAEDDAVGGYTIPAHTPVFLLQYLTHRHPACWDNPEGFDPERFAPERAAGRPPYAYFPFGGGPRQCIGRGFALMEAPLVLATVAQRYRLDLVPSHPVALEPQITLRPRYGMRMYINPSAR